MTTRRLLVPQCLVAGNEPARPMPAGAAASVDFTLAARPAMSAFRRVIALLVVTMTALVVAACSDDGGTEDVASTSGMIGPAGGTVALADGSATLTIPAGALGAATEIRITELSPANVPAHIAAIGFEKVYRLEPAGTQFVIPVRVTAKLAASPAGDQALLILESSGNFEAPANLEIEMAAAGRQLSGDIAHFSHVVVQEHSSVTVRMTATPSVIGDDEHTRVEVIISKSATNDAIEHRYVNPINTADPLRIDQRFDQQLTDGNYIFPKAANSISGYVLASCDASGAAHVQYAYRLRYIPAEGPFKDELIEVLGRISSDVECELAYVPIVPGGLYVLPGLTEPDGVSVLPGPFANLNGAGPYGAFAGAEGVVVLDLVTQEVVLDRTTAGPDGATLGEGGLGVLPVAHAASAGADAALVGFGNGGAFVQNYNAAGGWGGTARDFEPTFDAFTAGGELVADLVALVRPVLGVDFLEWDPVAKVYRAAPAKFVPLSDFPGAGQLVSAQIPDAAADAMLVLSRATNAGATSTKVFYKNLGDALPAVTLMSLGARDARRLRCIPVGTKHACVATMFGGEGLAFLFDPASPTATPRVTTLPAAAGTLGVAQALLANGRVAVVMANFTANSLTVAELSADLSTVHSSGTIPAPVGCMGTAHAALLTDDEGLKAVVTCNGSNKYWVTKAFP